MSDFVIEDGTLTFEGGGCRLATDPEIEMYDEIERLRDAILEAIANYNDPRAMRAVLLNALLEADDGQ